LLNHRISAGEQRKGRSEAERFGVPHFLATQYLRTKGHREAMSHELGLPKRREFRLELAESRHIVPEWTTHRAPSAVKAGLIRFYRGVTGLHSALGF
jgi:hypothetical protein